MKSNRLERWAADDALHWQEQGNALIHSDQGAVRGIGIIVWIIILRLSGTLLSTSNFSKACTIGQKPAVREQES